ncbi:MAG: GldG family protein [Lentisphaerae bacterium]|nr:GldG family protein [Lentisphaerota bacterium]
MTGSNQARKGIWRQRGRRLGVGFNTSVSIVLAACVLVMVNYLSSRYYMRWDISSAGFYRLSDKTKALLRSLDCEVEVIAFFHKKHDLFDDIRNLLKEYEYAAAEIPNLDLTVRFIDPDRDLARAKEIAQKYDVREPNVIIFDSGGRKKYVEIKEIVEYERLIDYEKLLDGRPLVKQKKIGFKGEQSFSSAIQSVTQSRHPVVYFVTGHAERDIEDYSEHSGYSSLARIMRRDNMEVRSIMLAGQKEIPKDAFAVIIAGPDRKFSQEEINILSKYLDENGRVFFLLDPMADAGLAPLLGKWGVKLEADVVVGLTMTGRELVVTEYGDHPITKHLRNVTTMFYMPRSVSPMQETYNHKSVSADRPRVSALALCSKEGWAEFNLNQNPPKFDVEVDKAGPIAVAAAIEKGAISGIDVEIKPTRIVVVGDSYFVSNSALKRGAGGNADFFMSAINWLVEREALMAVAPRTPGELRLDMSRQLLRTTHLLIGGGTPLVIALIGLMVWLIRRR